MSVRFGSAGSVRGKVAGLYCTIYIFNLFSHSKKIFSFYFQNKSLNEYYHLSLKNNKNKQ